MKANLSEMEGFLRGKCLPGDMKVNETNAQYLVRKFAEAEAKCAALAADNDTAMAALKQADEVVKSAYEKYVALADENMALKSARQNAMTLPETPATDAFLAEAWASGIDQWIASRDGRWNGTTVEAERFAAQLRQDANTAELVAAGIITRIED